MSPDMKRLVDAVRAIELDDELEHRTDSTGTGDKFGDVCGSEFVETIIRAVLTELWEIDDGLDCDAREATKTRDAESDTSALINHILAEPATA